MQDKKNDHGLTLDFMCSLMQRHRHLVRATYHRSSKTQGKQIVVHDKMTASCVMRNIMWIRSPSRQKSSTMLVNLYAFIILALLRLINSNQRGHAVPFNLIENWIYSGPSPFRAKKEDRTYNLIFLGIYCTIGVLRSCLSCSLIFDLDREETWHSFHVIRQKATMLLSALRTKQIRQGSTAMLPCDPSTYMARPKRWHHRCEEKAI